MGRYNLGGVRMVTSFRWEKLIYKLNRLVTVITLKTRKDCLPLFFFHFFYAGVDPTTGEMKISLHWENDFEPWAKGRKLCRHLKLSCYRDALLAIIAQRTGPLFDRTRPLLGRLFKALGLRDAECTWKIPHGGGLPYLIVTTKLAT